MPRKITRMSKTTLRLDESVLQAADVIARLEGVSVPDFIEFLIFSFAYRDSVGEPLASAPKPAGPSRPDARTPDPRSRHAAAKVIDLDAARERRRSAPTATARRETAVSAGCPSRSDTVPDAHRAERRHRETAIARGPSEARDADVRASDALDRTAWVWDYLLEHRTATTPDGR
jgi:hypothetical protein